MTYNAQTQMTKTNVTVEARLLSLQVVDLVKAKRRILQWTVGWCTQIVNCLNENHYNLTNFCEKWWQTQFFSSLLVIEYPIGLPNPNGYPAPIGQPSVFGLPVPSWALHSHWASLLIEFLSPFEHNPSRVESRFQGRPTEATKELELMQYGGLTSKDFIPGAEILVPTEQAEEDGDESGDEDDEEGS